MEKIKEYSLKFDKKFLEKYRRKIDTNTQKIIDKKILRLKDNPIQWKPLFNIYPHLYELYADSYRIYYLVQHNEIRIILIAYEHKDEQQKFLNSIKKDKNSIVKVLEENSR